MKLSSETARRDWVVGVIVVGAWVLSYLGARAALEMQLPTWLRVTVALVPVLPTALLLWCAIAGIRGMDELHRRVHLEALAVAYPLAILLIMTLGLLQLAIDLSPHDWSYRHVWPFLFIFYFLGLTLAWRRYQ
jgi:hypothetical protein